VILSPYAEPNGKAAAQQGSVRAPPRLTSVPLYGGGERGACVVHSHHTSSAQAVRQPGYFLCFFCFFLKVAVTVRVSVILTWQPRLPLHAPDQPPNVEPLAGLA